MDSLDISKKVAASMKGSDDPNFKRIHHYDHHVVLFIKDYILKEKCKNYFEIGTHFGHSLCTALQSKYKSKFVSCDLFDVGNSIAEDCQINNVEKLANDNASALNKNNYEFIILKDNSTLPDTKEKVKQLLPEGIDLLFIDGDHHYKTILIEFNLYYPLVNKGGYIVFDDYLPLSLNGIDRECPKAINQIESKYKEDIESGPPSSMLPSKPRGLYPTLEEGNTKPICTYIFKKL